MQNHGDELIRTRTTLIGRLKNWQDQDSWQDFFDTYWKLIYSVALKSGLSETDAQDVVQETMLTVAKQMPDFKYDRSLGSFKGWLLRATRSRIVDQFRRRGAVRIVYSHSSEPDTDVEHMDVPDGAHLDIDAIWEREWKKNLVETALKTAKRSVDPLQFQIFDMNVNKHWAAEKIAKTFHVSVGQVYLAKHRVGAVVKKEAERLAKILDPGHETTSVPVKLPLPKTETKKPQ